MIAQTSNEAVDRDRPKNFLNEREINLFLAAAKQGRYPERDYAMCLFAFRHGLRVSELVGMRADDVDLAAGLVFVRRRKGSLSTSHPLEADEIRAVKAWLKVRREREPASGSQPNGIAAHGDRGAGLLFLSERGPMGRHAFNYLCGEIAKRAGLTNVHPHTLRHSCGYALANAGVDIRVIQDFLGHRNLAHTALYTRTAARRFNGLWR